MKKKHSQDILNLFFDFKKNVLENKPSASVMLGEVQLMRFKIKPLRGDLSLLNLHDNNLLEALWNLGKLDEFFHLQYKELPTSERRTFFQLFDELHEQYQSQLNQLNIFKTVTANDLQGGSLIEMEIYKEDLPKKYN